MTGVETTAGTVSTGRVLLTGGPGLQAVARAAGARAWVGYARHQVVVTEQGLADLRGLIGAGRAHVAQAVNAGMVLLY